MTGADFDWLANELLTLIEAQEASLINWGFYESVFDAREEAPKLLQRLPPVAAVSWEEARSRGFTVDALLANLRDRKLLLGDEARSRTRFGEAIRLLAKLRQLFPNKPWTQAPSLVGDLRVVINPRRYPARDVLAQSLLARLKSAGIAPAVIDGVRALLMDDGDLIRLAAFQDRATLEQLLNLSARADRGIVIGAGTGAGKTKAFYVPALAHIAANITSTPHVQAIAVYPRIELLKDQLLEAYAEARKLDRLQLQRAKRPITIGAFYGDTPRSASELWNDFRTGLQSGWRCPFFRCQRPGCKGREYIWRRDDLEKAAKAEEKGTYGQHERLVCPSCHDVLAEGTIHLTREGMIRQPPDLLFITAEMLNRRLADGYAHRLLGIGADLPPRLLLLDEIHTYEGLTGAQTSFLLRRWRYARGRGTKANLCVVGLSATLAEAEDFFSQLTGLERYQVTYVRPNPSELIEEGAEYNVAVKGDPLSGAQLLSTSVQTAMLMGRILDPFRDTVPVRESPSRGALGRRMFAFTDQLDVVNRWHHIELDAEGKQRLASLRASDPRYRGNNGSLRFSDADEQARRSNGQIWRVSEEIGHRLSDPLKIALVSSQHRFAGSPADLVVATSSLEVGYNDPEVGAIIHHKAPKSQASFLQRKGRAGRTRAMRPWTIVVVSSFGRDRWAFQHSEELFQSDLRPITLPTDNVYIQKIQGAFALMDWLATTLRQRGHMVNVWNLLAGSGGATDQPARNAARDMLSAVLTGELRGDLEAYLTRSLGVDRDHLEHIFWGDPRSLMFEVLPTLTRQLETRWGAVTFDHDMSAWVADRGGADRIGRDPMPDFVPPNLFSDLNLPELLLTFTGNRSVGQDESIDLWTGLWEFAPGRVSKRFADKDNPLDAHWLAPPLPLPGSGDLALADIFDLDGVPRVIEFGSEEVRVYRPRVYKLQVVPPEIKQTSMGRLRWQSSLMPIDHAGYNLYSQSESAGAPEDPGDNIGFQLPVGANWTSLITRIASYEHQAGRAVDVVRAGTEVNVALGYRKMPMHGGAASFQKSDVRRHYRFRTGDGLAAIGFSVTADGLRFSYRPLEVDALLASDAWPQLRIKLAPEVGKSALRADDRMNWDTISPFEVDWLWEIEVAALTAIAIARGVSLEEAAAMFDTQRLSIATRTLNVIFQAQALSPNAESDGENPDPEGNPEDEGPRVARLLQLEEDEQVVAALRNARRFLWRDDDPYLRTWLVETYAVSLGAVIQAAALRLVPDLDPKTLDLDVTPDSIWITESTGGGVGHVVNLARAIRSRPRAFMLLLDDATRHCDREATAASLESIAAIVAGADNPLASVFARVRERGTLHQQGVARELLVNALDDCGVPVTREIVVNINAKFLRDLSGEDSDELIAALVRRWREEEQRLGCAIDLRSFAVAAWQLEDFQQPIAALLARIGQSPSSQVESQVFNVLQSMLWLSCPTSCPDCIEPQPRFAAWPRPSRVLVRSQLPAGAAPIRFGESGWDDALFTRLGETFAASVQCDQHEKPSLKDALVRFLVTPVETEYQVLYPVIERIVREERDWIVSLVIRELADA